MKPQLNTIVKKAYDVKNSTLNHLPFEIFTELVVKEILECSFSGLISVTKDSVADYDFIGESLWPIVLSTIDQQLSFIYSSANLYLFHKNFQVAQNFTKIISGFMSNNAEQEGSLISRFNIQTYFNVLMIESTESFHAELEKQYDQTNEKLKPIHPLTMKYALKCLSSDYYL